MKIRLSLLLIIAFLICGKSIAGEIVITGIYNGKNLYIQNPAIPDKGGFCTIKAYVNDVEVVHNPTTSAYEVDLSSVSLGQEVSIKIVHHDGCKPVVINPQVIKEKNPFKFVMIQLKDNTLGWTTSGDKIGDYYYVEKRIGEKWIMIKSLKAKGKIEKNNYSIGIMNSVGDNKYRIKCIQTGGFINYSPLVTYYSKNTPVTFYPTQVDDKIYLSRIADFEVLDVHGALMANGKQKEINVNELSAGLYYLVLEDKTEKFYKK
ncbi:T9SS C-terminal target domain-containing protein [Bacteroidota bacterium]